LDIAEMRKRAHFEARPFFVWDGLVHIAVSPHQHITTELTEADIVA
jgi:hypothetical protein